MAALIRNAWRKQYSCCDGRVKKNTLGKTAPISDALLGMRPFFFALLGPLIPGDIEQMCNSHSM